MKYELSYFFQTRIQKWTESGLLRHILDEMPHVSLPRTDGLTACLNFDPIEGMNDPISISVKNYLGCVILFSVTILVSMLILTLSFFEDDDDY